MSQEWNQHKYLIYEYLQTLLDKAGNIPACYFSSVGKQNAQNQKIGLGAVPSIKDKNTKKNQGTIIKNEKSAIIILHYVVEHLLRWTPTQMRDRFNQEVIDRLKLNRIVNMIIFPPEADRRTDYFIYAYKLYPDEIKIDRRKLTIIVFEKVINKALSKFPKGFFDDSLGRYRATICLNYALQKYSSFNNIEELYSHFSGAEGKKLVKKYHLELARRLSWDCAIDYLHESLSPSDKNEVWYHFYSLF